MIPSVAFLGLGSSHWNIKATINALHQKCAIQTFANYPGGFGDPRKNLNKLIAADKVAAVEIQLTYSKPKTLVTLEWMDQQLPLWIAFQANHPGIPVYVSHTTEHHEQNKAKLIERMELIKAAGLIPVNNPEPGLGAILPNYINETHKPARLPGQYIASMDGFDTLVYGNVKHWAQVHKDALFNFAWSGLCNLNNGRKGSDTPTPCSKRTAAPGRKHIEMLVHLSICPPPPPTALPFNPAPFKGAWLWKPVREYTEDKKTHKPDCRNDMPCLISPVKADKFVVCTVHGDPIGVLPFYDVYKNKNHPEKNGFRYYAGSPGGCRKWGYELAQKALIMSGSPYVSVRTGRDYHGLFEPSHRTGYFD